MARASVFSAIVLALGLGCSIPGTDKPSGLVDIDHIQARELLKSKPTPVIIDVRSPEEFNGELGHIDGARLIPLPNLADSLASLAPMRDSVIILVCRSGRRSGIAGKAMVDAGFKNVYNLKGGMLSWNSNR